MLSDRRRRLLARLSHRKSREREGLVLVEGVRGVGDLLASGVPVRFVLVDPTLEHRPEGAALHARLEAAGVEIEAVGKGELARVADTESPQGVLAVCEQPRADLDTLLAGASDGLLILDAVQDPGNVGTLLRAARAFGLSGAIALDGTADPWSPKTVRAAAGAALSLGIATAHWSEAGPALEKAGVDLYLADASGDPVTAVAAPDGRWALVVGNEGAGPRAEVAGAAARTVAIPMPGGSESLNAAVAGSILLFALTVAR